MPEAANSPVPANVYPSFAHYCRTDFADYFRTDYKGLILFAMAEGCANVEEAKDAVQEILLDVCLKWPTIKTPKAYARKALKHHIAKVQQTARRDQNTAQQHMEELIGVFERKLDLAEEIQTVDDLKAVLKIARAMPKDQLEVMAWVLSGYTTAEIAKEIGKKDSTVRSLLRHARTTISKLTRDTPIGKEGDAWLKT